MNPSWFKPTHGHRSNHKQSGEYLAWSHAKQRTTNPNDESYPQYGGRGIHMCEQWLNSFEKFFCDMGPKPSPKHSIDRINNNGHYEPGNCRWATVKQQNRNTSRNRIVEFKGTRKIIMEWSESTGLLEGTIRRRLNDGWGIEEALTTPSKKNPRALIAVG